MFNPATLAAVSLLALAAPPVAPVAPVPPRAVTPPTPAVPPRPLLDEVPAALDWEVKPSEREDAPPGSVQFQIGFHTEDHSWMNGDTVPLAQLEGLTTAQLAADGQAVSFVLRRDAGDFRCRGVAGQGRGVGTCQWAASPGFADALARRGIGKVDPIQQFELAMGNIGFAYLDELKRQAYATPAADDLVRAGTHGVSLRVLREMDAAGYRLGDLPGLIAVRDHGVNARFITALRESGYAHLSAAELVRLRDHGVSASYIGQLKDQGYAHLAAEDLVRLRDHGVGVGFIAELRDMGYGDLRADELARLRDHGVSPGFIRAANRDGRKLSPEDLIRLRDRGE